MARFALIASPLGGETHHISGNIGLILAPSNLGLRPTESGGQPGTWQAPQALVDVGLTHALEPRMLCQSNVPLTSQCHSTSLFMTCS
jgi:hypothetical protein